MAMVLYPHIVADEDIQAGRPVIEGTQVAVSTLVAQVAAGSSLAEVASANGVTEEDVRAALDYAAQLTEKPAIGSAPGHVQPRPLPPLSAEENSMAEEEARRIGLDPNALSPLGRRLFAIRARGFASGETQPMTWEELDAEISEQRHKRYYDDEA